MNSLCATLALLSFLLFATTIESRIGAGGYKGNAIEKQPMPEDLWKLMKEQFELSNVDLSNDKVEKADCHENLKPNIEFEVVEFEPRPNVSAYHADIEVTESSDAKPESKDNGPKDEQPFVAKSEKHSFAEDFEQRPNVSVYND